MFLNIVFASLFSIVSMTGFCSKQTPLAGISFDRSKIVQSFSQKPYTEEDPFDMEDGDCLRLWMVPAESTDEFVCYCSPVANFVGYMDYFGILNQVSEKR